jgi:hypothetical protein
VESGRSTRPASSKTMNLIGSRPTLIVNLCALAVAAVLAMEATYIVHERLGYYLPLDSLAFLFPALVMFIVRNRNFSFFFWRSTSRYWSICQLKLEVSILACIRLGLKREDL